MRDGKRKVGSQDDEARRRGPRRPYLTPRLTVHGTVETVTRHDPPPPGRGHDKPKHTKHPHPHQ